MAPRIDNMVDMVRGVLNRDNEPEDQDEYLDRLGVEDESNTNPESPLYVRRTAENVLNNYWEENTPTFEQARAAAQRIDTMMSARRRGPDTFQREYLGDFNVQAATAIHDRHYSGMDSRERYNRRTMYWSDGAGEVRPQREMQWTRRYRDRGDVRAPAEAGSAIHEKVREVNIRIIDMILHETRLFIHELLDRSSGSMPIPIMESAINHFLEDMGDNIFLRHHVNFRRSTNTFSEWIEIQLEMPDGLVRRMGIDTRELEMRRG